jgi:hypothetical protein
MRIYSGLGTRYLWASRMRFRADPLRSCVFALFFLALNFAPLGVAPVFSRSYFRASSLFPFALVLLNIYLYYKERKVSTRKLGQDRQNMTSRTRQPEQDRQESQTGQAEREKTEHPERKRQTGYIYYVSGQDKQNGTGRTGQAERDRQNGTGRKGQAERDR